MTEGVDQEGCLPKTAWPRLDDYFKSINVKAVYQTNEPFILGNKATHIFFLEDTFARSDDRRVLQRFEQGNSFNEVAQQYDAYTDPDVEDFPDVPNIFENYHVNHAGEKIDCRARRKYALEAIIKLLFISSYHDKCLLFMLELY